MDDALRARLERLAPRLAEVNARLSDPQAARDLDQYRRLNREHRELTELLDCFARYRQAEADLATAEELRADPDLREFADGEAAAAQERLESLRAKVQRLLLPRDPDDDRDVLLEIRAGTGGDESALFAGDLLRMYLRHAERRGWQTELLSASPSEIGGYREVIVRVSGEAVFSRLKFESGVHRVQRVPQTEAQGRIHTSACTVAVLAEADEVGEVQFDPQELRIDVFRASGAGGQHVNKTESAVRITHLPTGLVAECQDDRSQHRNRERALKVLAARLKDLRSREAQQKEAAHRKSLVGSGDRSERIRTYNFPQGRITDHRINLTLYRLVQILDGDLDELVGALIAAREAELLASLADAS
jgi:peptide chain release factor 1